MGDKKDETLRNNKKSNLTYQS